MNYEPAPTQIVDEVAEGLLDPHLSLRAPVLVKVPLRRRDPLGWPTAIFSAAIHGLLIPEGIAAVWAVSRVGDPVSSLNAAACEFTHWTFPAHQRGVTTLAAEILSTYPEAVAAQQRSISIDRAQSPRQ